MATNWAKRHLARSLKQENARLVFEVVKLRIELALIKDKGSLCDELKCELEHHKEALFHMRAPERKTIPKIIALVDNESHWPVFT